MMRMVDPFIITGSLIIGLNIVKAHIHNNVHIGDYVVQMRSSTLSTERRQTL